MFEYSLWALLLLRNSRQSLPAEGFVTPPEFAPRVFEIVIPLGHSWFVSPRRESRRLAFLVEDSAKQVVAFEKRLLDCDIGSIELDLRA